MASVCILTSLVHVLNWLSLLYFTAHNCYYSNMVISCKCCLIVIWNLKSNCLCMCTFQGWLTFNVSGSIYSTFFHNMIIIILPCTFLVEGIFITYASRLNIYEAMPACMHVHRLDVWPWTNLLAEQLQWHIWQSALTQTQYQVTICVSHGCLVWLQIVLVHGIINIYCS